MGRAHAISEARSEGTADAPAEEPVGLELLGVALCLAGVVFAAALASYGPPGPGLRNVAGTFGEGLAGATTRALGVGAWVFPLAAILWGLACVRGRSPRHWALRAFLLLPLAALLGALATLLLRDVSLPGLHRSGPGGYVGVAFASGLYHALGQAASLVVLAGVLGLSRLVLDLPFSRMRTTLFGWMGDREGAGLLETDEEEDAVEDEEEEAEGDDDGEEWEYEYEYEDVEEEEEDEAEPEKPSRKKAKKAKKKPARKAPPPKKARPLLSRPKKAPKAKPAPKKAGRRQVGEYVFPPTELLDAGEPADPALIREEVESNAKVLGEALASFGVEARVVSSVHGPVITFFEIAIGSGVRLNRVTALADDLAIALKAPSVRIVAPIPGRSTVGVEVPNLTREIVRFRDVAEEGAAVADRKSLPLYLGRNTAGHALVEDLAKMPHLLIAGATGSGKSVCINSILLSILYTRTPDEVSLILIDPKQVELSFFEGIPQLLTPVVTDMKRAAKILEWAVDKMENRYSLLLAAGVRNISGYNALSKTKIEEMRERASLSEEDAPEKLSQIVIVVDELADLMMISGKDVELAITRLAQKSRAVGIHIILATQRPSTNVITGLIKANMPTRIAFCVSSKIDSRVILDANGADKLLGMGDMLYMNPRSLHVQRAQGALVTDQEVRTVVDWIKANGPEPDYQDLLAAKREGMGDPMEEDDLYDDAVRAVLTTRLGSASMLQRRLSVGYTRASRLIDMMCDRGVVGPHVGSKAREVLFTLDDWEAMRAEERGEGQAPSRAFGGDDDDLEDRCPDESWD